ncbi:hypothetical protein T10_6196 [Trichinella papuae]|uniref:Uncharacterized protein n=1 Tax=Trichinella papuae TaxID=268474 RepID=A0A0V1LZK9_9BILA|nr:hypothetical protein T10_6196 [Trichinella papuae]
MVSFPNFTKSVLAAYFTFQETVFSGLIAITKRAFYLACVVFFQQLCIRVPSFSGVASQ